MSILNGFKAFERYLKTPNGYQLYSERQLAKDVLMGDGKDESNNIENTVAQLSNPNLLINGDFQVWQRGEQFHYASKGLLKYNADMWSIYSANNTEHKCDRVENGLKFWVTNNQNALTQILEQKLGLGEDYVLSAMIDGVVHTMPIIGGEYCNSEDGRLGYLDYGSKNERVTINPIGETVVSWVKLEKGKIATPFVPRTYAEELFLCQNYYFILPGADFVMYSGKSGILYLPIEQLSRMRGSCTVIHNIGIVSICSEGESSEHAVDSINISSLVSGEIAIHVAYNTKVNRPVCVEIPSDKQIIFDSSIY